MASVESDDWPKNSQLSIEEWKMFFSSFFNQKNFFSHPKKFQKLQIITHSEESKEFYKKKFQMFSQFLTFSSDGKNLMNITMGCLLREM